MLPQKADNQERRQRMTTQKGTFGDWLASQSSATIEEYVARQTPIVKGQTDNLKSAKVELTDRINNEGYTCAILKVEGGQTTRPETNNPETIALIKAWVLAHVDDKAFLSKVASVAILKEQTGLKESELVEKDLCCIALEQYKFKTQ